MQAWGKPEHIIAQKKFKNEVKGLLSKSIELHGDEFCVVIDKNNRIIDEFGPGQHKIKGGFNHIVMIDTSTKTLRKPVSGLKTGDDQTVACDLELKFNVYYPEKFSRNLLGDKNILNMDDLFFELQNQIIAKVLAPIVKDLNAQDLYGNKEIIDEIQEAFEVELKKSLELWGIEIIDFSLIWKFSEDYKQYLDSKGRKKLASQDKEEEYEEELKEAVREREVEKVKKSGQKSKEDVKSELEKEALEAEVKGELEREENVRDAEEALQGLKLKDMMDKQKKKKEDEEDE